MDAFVTEYGFRTGKTFIYQPGSGEVTMKTGMGMDLDKLRELIKSIEHHELQINIDGTIFVYSPEEHGEKPMKPEDLAMIPETEPETEEHRAPTPEEIEAMKLEDEEIPEEIVEAIEDVAEIRDIEDREETREEVEDVVVIIE